MNEMLVTKGLTRANPNTRKKLSAQTCADFIRSLADLLSAGIDLPWSLQTVSSLTQNRTLKLSCIEQSEALMQGHEWPDVLSDSLHPVWPESLVAWARVAIKTGALVDCLNCQHGQWMAVHFLRSNLGKRLSYPAGVLTLSLVLTWFTGSQFQSDSNQVLWLGTAVAVCATGLCGIGLWQYRKKGGISHTRNWCNCLHALALMTKAGLSWTQALSAVLEELDALWKSHPDIGLALEDCLDAVRAGHDIFTAAEQARLPDSLLRSLKLAQMTGDLPSALLQTANLFDMRRKVLEQQILSALPSAALALAAATLAMQYALFIQPLYAQLGNV
jgi:type II secretory pathway component PulF